MYNLLDKGLFLKNRPRLAKKRSVRPSSRLKTVDLDCRSSLSVAQLVRFWFKSLQSLTVHDRQFLQGNLFLLAVCTHDVGLYLRSIFCTRSLLQFSAASYRAFGARNTPQLYPVTLNLGTYIDLIPLEKGFVSIPDHSKSYTCNQNVIDQKARR